MSKAIFTKDFTTKTVMIEKTFQANKDKVWAAYTDGDTLAKWWGPKEWPASNLSFDFSQGGHWHYCMTGPDGTKACGKITYLEINPKDSFSANDAFADEKGNIDETLPKTNWNVIFEGMGDTTKVTTKMTFGTAEDMQKLVEMGFEEGFTSSLSNLEEYLAS